MAYENININSLDTALNSIDNISDSQISNNMNSITINDWQSPVRINIVNALSAAIEEYKIIQMNIEICKTIASLIRSYKEQDEEYERYSSKANEYKRKYEKYKYKTNLDANEEYWKQHYKNKYNEYVNKKSSSASGKSEIQNKIDSKVGNLK